MKNKVLKGLLSVLLCLGVFCYSFSLSSVFVSASSVTEIIDTSYSDWSELPEDFKAIGESYLSALRSVSNGDFKGYFDSITDIPLKWFKTLKDGTAALSPIDDIYYIIGDNGELTGVHSGGGGSHSGGFNSDDIVIPTETFKEVVEEANTTNSPKGKGLFKQSYRTDTYIHSNYDTSRITLFNEPGLKESFEDLYLYPFYMDENGEYYYTDSQIHLYYVPNDDPNSDIALQCDSYLYGDSLGFVLDSTYSKIIKEFTSATVPFVYSLNPLSNISSEFLYIYNSEIDYSKNQPNSSTSLTFLKIGYYNSDRSVCFYPNFNTGEFSSKYSYNSERGFPYRDIGYICSHEMISRQYNDIDTSKIPDNYYVTISGDTIYDYSITNPETGESDTINNYVTNNYTYITNNNGGEGSGGSGGSGGNVTVGGQIDVSGSVGVDINVSVPDININVNQGAGGTVENPNDYIDASGGDVDVGGVLGKLPQLSKGFVDYLKGFFSWLPAEIYGLILLILVISVFNVFRAGR